MFNMVSLWKMKKELMAYLKEDIKKEVENMTPARGRQLLNEAGIMVLPGWDLSVSYIFDSIIKSGKKDIQNWMCEV